MAENKFTSTRRYEAELDRQAQLKLETAQPHNRREHRQQNEETGFIVPSFVTLDMVHRLIDRIKRV